jgi:hypothetical protein
MEEENKKTNEIQSYRSTGNDFNADSSKLTFQIIDECNSRSNRGNYHIFSNESLKPIVQNKIIFLTNLHEFFYNLSNYIFILISKINSITIKKFENTLDQNKYFLKFFRDIMGCYERFSTDLLKSKAIFSTSIKEEKLIFNEINSMIDKSQESLSSNFLTFSTILNQSIVQNGPFTKIQSFYKRMKIIVKNISDDLNRLKSKNERLLQKSKRNTNIFEEFSNLINNDSETIPNFFSKNDFFTIEANYTKTVNKLIDINKKLLRNYIGYFADMKLLIVDYLNLMKETIEIYLNANKKVFTDAASIDSIQSAFNNITKESIESNFTPSLFFKENLKEINEILHEFQTSLNKYNFIKADNAYIDSNFLLENHKSLNDFLGFIIEILPYKYDIEKSNLITYLTQVKRDPGLFQSWKNSMLLITVQNNLYLFDRKIIKPFDIKIGLGSIQFKKKIDSKSEIRIELKEQKKGLIFNFKVTALIEALGKDHYDEIMKILSHYGKQDKLPQSQGSNKNVGSFGNNVNNTD